MKALRYVLPALCLVGIAGTVAYADTATSTPSTTTTPGAHWHGHRHHGGFWHVLKQLNLTADQQTQIKSILAQSKTANQALYASIRSNLRSLAVTAPTDPSYPALLATAKSNAAARIQAQSDVKTQIYAVLTPAQIAQIPGIIAADRAAWKAKAAAWKSRHAQS